MIYPSGMSGNIGNLLRLIQEEKASSIANLPPATEAGSPIRGLIQQPLQAPEAPGANRMVSLRPEGVTQMGPEVTPQVVGPVANPIPPSPAGPSPVGPSAPSGGNAPVSPTVSRPMAQVSMPNIGTKVTSAPSVKGVSTGGPMMSQQPGMSKPTASPAPPVINRAAQPAVSTGGFGSVGIGGTIASAAEKILPKLAPLAETALGRIATRLLPILMPTLTMNKYSNPFSAKPTKG